MYTVRKFDEKSLQNALSVSRVMTKITQGRRFSYTER